MTVRVIRFQSLLSEIGMTGWTLRFHCVTSFGPMPKLKLFWNGTLIMLAIGFWAALASASWSLAAWANRPEASASKKPEVPKMAFGFISFSFVLCQRELLRSLVNSRATPCEAARVFHQSTASLVSRRRLWCWVGCSRPAPAPGFPDSSGLESGHPNRRRGSA